MGDKCFFFSNIDLCYIDLYSIFSLFLQGRSVRPRSNRFMPRCLGVSNRFKSVSNRFKPFQLVAIVSNRFNRFKPFQVIRSEGAWTY